MNIVRIQGNKERQNKIYYEVDFDNAPIGVGGMGQVYRGHQVSEITKQKREVAIKFLDESLPKHIIERAMREAEIDVKHENLLEMLGFVENVDYTKEEFFRSEDGDIRPDFIVNLPNNKRN